MKESVYLLLGKCKLNIRITISKGSMTKKCSRTYVYPRFLLYSVPCESPHAKIAHQCSCINCLTIPLFIHFFENTTWSTLCAQCLVQSYMCCPISETCMNTSSLRTGMQQRILTSRNSFSLGRYYLFIIYPIFIPANPRVQKETSRSLCIEPSL